METDARAQSLPPTDWNEEHSRGRTSRPSLLKGRGEVHEELRKVAVDPIPLFIQGHPGVGTSVLAWEYVSELRAQLNDQNPVVIRVDASAQNAPKGDPTHGIAVALLQHFMPGETFHGSSTGRIICWFLRRVMVGGRPVVVWLDQLRPNVRSLGNIVKPLLNPTVFLGDAKGVPPVFLVLSGSGTAALSDRVKRLYVPPLPAATVREIMEARILQTGRVWTLGALGKLTDIMATRGNSLSATDEILAAAVGRAECHGIIVEQDVAPPSSREGTRMSKRQVELRLLGVLRTAGGKLPMGELVAELGRSFSSDGESAPSPSNVRRWTVRLQALGRVKRSVAVGGNGGSRSMVSLV